MHIGFGLVFLDGFRWEGVWELGAGGLVTMCWCYRWMVLHAS